MNAHLRSDEGRECPYCGATMMWIPLRWVSRGTFVCGRCGEFPDLRLSSEVQVSPHSDDAAAIDHRDERPRVLMIDDSTTERDLYALMLQPDAKVLTAARGAEGLALAEKERPDAIVLDVMMPGMDGWEVCRRLKSNPRTARIPVVMLTAQDEPNLTQEASRLGAEALLHKPCSIEQLTAVLTAAIATSH